MKFVVDCPKPESVVEFGVKIGVKIDEDGDPILYLKYKDETIQLAFLNARDGCPLYIRRLASSHIALLKEIGINVSLNHRITDDE